MPSDLVETRRETDQPPTNVAGHERTKRFLAFGSLLAAVGVGACCVVPFALFMLGISGAWIGNLTALEPYQPLFAALALGAIGYGFHLIYRKPKAECAGEGDCASPRSDRVAKTGLWAASVVVAVGLAFPQVAPLFL